jgi:signal transduction histidine kinase
MYSTIESKIDIISFSQDKYIEYVINRIDYDQDIIKESIILTIGTIKKLIKDNNKIETKLYKNIVETTPNSIIFQILSKFKEAIFYIDDIKIDNEFAYKINNIIDRLFIEIVDCSNIDNLKNEISEKNSEIESLTKKAQMGDMLSLIAHQWRQPLNNINIIASTNKLDIELSELNVDSILKSYEDISQQVSYLTNTVDDFRNFFNPNKLKENVNLDTTINKSLSILSRSLEINGIEIVKDYHFTSTVYTLANELMQVVLNLIKNAQDSLVDSNISNPMILIVGYENSNESIIEILDNGNGIDESIIDNIFEPYFTTKDKSSGTGLGLSMCKKIIEENCKGKLEVENLADGVKFSIILPYNSQD